MSLINDALKRAKQLPKLKPGSGPGGPSLQPHDGKKHGSSKGPVLVLVIILALGGGGYWYFFMKGGKKAPNFNVTQLWKKGGAPTNAPAKPMANANKGGTNKLGKVNQPMAGKMGSNSLMSAGPKTSPSPSTTVSAKMPMPAPNGTSTPAPPRMEMAMNSESTGSARTVATNGSAPGAPEAAPGETKPSTSAAPSELPPLKLQGIFYRLSKPSVLINGQTLYRGDSIEGLRVVEIRRQSVTLEKDGQVKTLAFGQK